MRLRFWCLTSCLLLSTPLTLHAQEKHWYQTDFTTSEFAARRARI